PSLDIVDVDGLKEAAARAFANDPGGATAYGTSVGYVPLRKWIAEQHGVDVDNVLVTNGSMQADAFLFDELVAPGDAVVVGRPTMLSMSSGEHVVYASSFSKTVCPGIRVGYLVGPAELITRIQKRATNTYISPNMVAQAIVYEFCASGAIRRSIETVKDALRERVQKLAAALERDLPDASFVPPEGGYFMRVTLPGSTDVRAMLSQAAARGVQFVKGTDFLLEGGNNTLRL